MPQSDVRSIFLFVVIDSVCMFAGQRIDTNRFSRF